MRWSRCSSRSPDGGFRAYEPPAVVALAVAWVSQSAGEDSAEGGTARSADDRRAANGQASNRPISKFSQW